VSKTTTAHLSATSGRPPVSIYIGASARWTSVRVRSHPAVSSARKQRSFATACARQKPVAAAFARNFAPIVAALARLESVLIDERRRAQA
jgi:hypothetical protein